MSETKQTSRQATPPDIPQIVGLINRAFAVERFFKSGDRIDVEQVRLMMEQGTFLLLEDENQLLACVFVKVTDDRGYIGTLSVDPERQRSGLGRRLMHEAEEYCRSACCKAVDIRIVNLRTELPAIYHKFGFVETGTQSAEVIRNTTQPVHFITMSKPL